MQAYAFTIDLIARVGTIIDHHHQAGEYGRTALFEKQPCDPAAAGVRGLRPHTPG